MHINDILEKIGVKSTDDLTPAEQATYRQWSAIISKPDITIDDLKTLLPKELDRAHTELRKFDNSAEKDLFYKAYADLCQNITKMITSPAKEREQLSAMLKQKYGIE